MAEGAGLLNRYTALNRIGGSNPPLSARFFTENFSIRVFMHNLVESYNNFQNSFGQDIKLDYPRIVASLFSEDFKKIANGVELVSNAEGLINQLQSIKGTSGAWSIDVNESISSLCNKKFTLSYILNSEKLGKFEVIAIITASDQNKINSVREVYYQF